MAKLKIENVIATADFQKPLNLQAIAENIGGKYSPEDFPAVMYKMDNPKTAFLIFDDGKIICSGAKTIEDSEYAIDKFAEEIKEKLMRTTIKVKNIVAHADFEKNLDIEFLKDKLGMGDVEYNPEEHPFLIYKLDRPKVEALIFNNGKVVITGAVEERDINKAVMKIEEEIRQVSS